MVTFKELSYVYAPDMPYKTTALDRVDLDIAEGKITAIIGKTGSGKSTLVQHLNALLLPTSGTLEIEGYTIKAGEKTSKLKELRRKVGLVFQFSEYQLFEETIIKDVAFGPKNFGVSEEEALERAKKALELVGLDPSYYQRSPLDISGGQKRRAAIAGILAIEPEIIVLDEPTAGLDPKGAKEMIGLFAMLNKKMHKTIIIVTHDNEIVYDFADDVVLLDGGKVVCKMKAHDFFAERELLESHDIYRPRIVYLKELLKDKGIMIPDDIHTLADLAVFWRDHE